MNNEEWVIATIDHLRENHNLQGKEDTLTDGRLTVLVENRGTVMGRDVSLSMKNKGINGMGRNNPKKQWLRVYRDDNENHLGQTTNESKEDSKSDNVKADETKAKDATVASEEIPRNLILQGPPGTGKTHAARQLANWLVNNHKNIPTIQDAIKKISELNLEATRVDENLKASQSFKMVQFHPATSYEDFVRGIRAKTVAGEAGTTVVTYDVEHGYLSEVCDNASKSDNQNQNFVLIIDEINRANLPAVLGECIFALEYRDRPVETAYQIDARKELKIPRNLWIIGTMNTADRSVGHLDYAIRRRFLFVDCPSDPGLVCEENKEAKAAFEKVRKIVSQYKSEEFEEKDIQIGHAYFMGDDWKVRLEYQVKPILREYERDGILRPESRKEIDGL